MNATVETNTTANFEIDGKSFQLPIYHGSEGPSVVSVSSLAKEGVFTLDPGYLSTASCESKITFIDGQKGILLYRGYPIDQLASKKNFLEVCYLLLYGELPTQAQKEQFENDITHHTMLHEQMVHFFRGTSTFKHKR